MLDIHMQPEGEKTKWQAAFEDRIREQVPWVERIRWGGMFDGELVVYVRMGRSKATPEKWQCQHVINEEMLTVEPAAIADIVLRLYRADCQERGWELSLADA